MTVYRKNSGDGLAALFRDIARGRRLNRGAAWGMMIIGALLAFEISNFNATRFALTDIIGELSFGGVRWATILAIAFCGIDFAGIARIFTPEQGRNEPAEVWYLFGAWLLAAAFNAVLTWWGVSVAVANHQTAGSALLGAATVTRGVPIFVAAMVWLIRVLIIGTFSIAGDRLFSSADARQSYRSYSRPAAPVEEPRPQPRPAPRPVPTYIRPAPRPVPAAPANLRTPASAEPTYHPVGMTARGLGEQTSTRM